LSACPKTPLSSVIPAKPGIPLPTLACNH